MSLSSLRLKLRKIIKQIVKDYMPLIFKLWLFKLVARATGNPNYYELLGESLEESADFKGARNAYSAALVLTEKANGFPASLRKQSYEYKLARVNYKTGAAHPEDPLLYCQAKPMVTADERNDSNKSGFFKVKFLFNGLLIMVTLKNKEIEYLDLLIDDLVFRRLVRKNKAEELTYTVIRTALDRFPVNGQLRVRAADGTFLPSDGSKGLVLEVPHGSNEIRRVLEECIYLDKKGHIPLSAEEVSQRQNSYLILYEKASNFFKEEIGKPLFLMYGTLLGQHREGDFIKNDDDFDVGYISEEDNPLSVKEEAKKIITKLVQAGFTVSFNQIGRPFRLRDGEGEAEIHLDVRPLWRQDGKIWAHKQACLPLTLDDFIPLKQAKLREVDVYIPGRPDHFLAAYYGPGWKVPDPSFYNDQSSLDPYIIKNLARACFTIGEFKVLEEELYRQKESSKMGKLIFKSIHDLYPLAVYEENCGWS